MASVPAGLFLAVLFDFDGTLTHPDALDFPALRSAIGCPPGTLILEYIEALPTEDERARKRKVLGDFEMAAARASVPNDGAEQMIHALKSRGVRIGILTVPGQTAQPGQTPAAPAAAPAPKLLPSRHPDRFTPGAAGSPAGNPAPGAEESKPEANPAQKPEKPAQPRRNPTP